LVGRHWETGHSDIRKVMICLCHEENTVDKNVWRQPTSSAFPNCREYYPYLKELGFAIKE
jgi:hypothetical protein